MPAFAEVHQRLCLEVRRRRGKLVEAVFTEKGLKSGPNIMECSSIALKALLDGPWIERCLAIELFNEDEIADIGIRFVDAMLDL